MGRTFSGKCSLDFYKIGRKTLAKNGKMSKIITIPIIKNIALSHVVWLPQKGGGGDPHGS
jgi:hypothetical protein